MAAAKKAVKKATKRVAKKPEKFSQEWHLAKQEARRRIDGKA